MNKNKKITKTLKKNVKNLPQITLNLLIIRCFCFSNTSTIDRQIDRNIDRYKYIMNNEQMIAFVECFIHHRTGKEVRIAKPTKPNHYLLLTKAYENCKGFFIKH